MYLAALQSVYYYNFVILPIRLLSGETLDGVGLARLLSGGGGGGTLVLAVGD